jgi:hypothetical protein
MAIIRQFYDPNNISTPSPLERVVDEREFSFFMESYKSSSREWQSVECI